MKAPKGHESIAGGQRSAAPGTIAERSSRPEGAPAHGCRRVLSNPKRRLWTASRERNRPMISRNGRRIPCHVFPALTNRHAFLFLIFLNPCRPQPRWGWRQLRTLPKVGEYANLGLTFTTPLGLMRLF